MHSYYGFGAFVLVIAAYLIPLLRRSSRPVRSPADFFLSQREHDESEFSATQTAYLLQMATIYPFFLFAISGIWWLALWNTLFYAIGIVLLAALLPKFAKTGIALLGSSKTLHKMIADIHGAPELRRYTAMLSVIAFAGLATFELYWGAKIVSLLFEGRTSILFISLTLVAAYLIVFLMAAGQRGAVRSSYFQLVIAYVGLHAVVAWTVMRPEVQLSKTDAPLLFSVIVVAAGFMLWERAQLIRNSHRRRSDRAADAIAVASLSAMVLAIVWKIVDEALAVGMPVFALRFTAPAELSPILPLLGFALLPLFFQFTDMSNWQRIASIEAANGEESLVSHVRRGLFRFLAESPLSWLLPVAIGLTALQAQVHFQSPAFVNAQAGGEPADPWVVFIAFVTSQPEFSGALLAAAFVAGITSVFLTTATSLLSAIGYTYAFDVDRSTRKLSDAYSSDARKSWSPEETRQVTDIGMRGMAVALAGIVALYMFVEMTLSRGATVLGLFLSFYAPMVAFAPAIIIPAIFGVTASGMFAATAIGTGVFAGLVTGFVSAFVGGDWQYYSLLTPLLSWPVYALGLLRRRRLITSGG